MTSLLADGMLLSARAVKRSRRNPASIIGAIVFPLLYFAMFNVVMRRVMNAQGFDYIQLLPPTIITQAMIFTGMASAYYIAADRLSGMASRLRSLPVHRAAPIVGRAIGDLVRAAISLTVVTVVAVASGMRFESFWGGVGFVLMALGFALVVSLGTGLIGYVASSPDAAVSIAMIPYVPLLMFSSGLVPVENFPGWMQPLVRWQPVTTVIDALRALIGDGAVNETLPAALVWLGSGAVVFAILGSRAFTRSS